LMHICHVGNMANDGYATVKALRAAGVNVELLIDPSDFGMGLPQWEIHDIMDDPYQMSLSKLNDYPLPEWVKIYTREKNPFKKAVDLFKATRGYDLLHCHFPTFNYLQFSRTPYLIYEAGFLRKIHDYNTHPKGRMNWEHLGLDAFRGAECVTWTNTDMKPMIDAVGVNFDAFIPFAIDTNRYIPTTKRGESDELQLFHPTRQTWNVKGNDRLLRAFTRLIKAGAEAHLTLVDWGYAEDVQAAKTLLKPVEEHVSWVPPMSKPRLIKTYQESDVVVDQFLLGASGTAGFEAMSCGKPLLMYFSESATRCFGEKPPHLDARCEDDILVGLMRLRDANLREKLGAEARGFVERRLSEVVVARRLRDIYDAVYHKAEEPRRLIP